MVSKGCEDGGEPSRYAVAIEVAPMYLYFLAGGLCHHFHQFYPSTCELDWE